jgi:hypothetical protein
MDEYKKLYKLSDKCAKLQTKDLTGAEIISEKIDKEVKKLKDKQKSFNLFCNNTVYNPPVKIDNMEYFRPLFKMETHRLLKEVSADDSYAVDFDVPAGTEVYAVQSGVVTALQDKSVEGGNDKKFSGKDNYLYIYNEETKLMFCYRHLEKFENISLKNNIKKGELIGRVGVTGYVITPHLHFVIYDFHKNRKIILKSLPIKFA